MREWLLRTTGAVLILLAAGGWGMREIREGRRRLREMDAALRFVRHIRENIDRLARPLPQIYASWEDPALVSNGFLDLLWSEGMEAAVEGAAWSLSDAERAILRDLAAQLGRGFREEQTALCRYAEDGLADALERLKKETGDRERLWRSIPLLAALSLILLLL